MYITYLEIETYKTYFYLTKFVLVDNIQFHEWVASKAEFQTPLKKNERTSFKMALL